jgi:hypothetical protein
MRRSTRYGKRRPKTTEEMCEVKVVVAKSAKEKLDALAGKESLGWAFEKLVEREMMRRMRKMEKSNTPIQDHDIAC